MTHKICFCFLIYDKIVHEDIWYNFFKFVNKDLYEIVVHYKQHSPLQYFEQYKMSNCLPTKYGRISVVNAQNYMTTMYDDCSHYIMLSGVCIPLKSFDYIYNYLKPGFSYFNYFEDIHNFPRCNPALKYLQKHQVKKANTNSIICNTHIRAIIKHQELYTKWFGKIKNADEHCHITLLHYLNLQKQLITTQNTCYSGATMFAAWSDMKDYTVFPSSVKSNSYTYHTICNNELQVLQDSPCLFGRKFMENCDIVKNDKKYKLLECVPRCSMPVYVINTDTHYKKRMKFDEQVCIKYEYIMNNDSHKLFDMFHKNCKLSNSDKMCISNHMKIFEKMINENVELCCVFEDNGSLEDVNLNIELRNIEHNFPKECTVAYVGGKGNWEDFTMTIMNDYFYKKKSKKNFTTIGVIYTRKLALKYINYKFKFPIDWTFTIKECHNSCIYHKRLLKYN